MDEKDPITEAQPEGFVEKALNLIERVGNKLPDPAALFLILLFVVWIISWMLSGISFAEIDPRTSKPIVINNLLSGTAIASFLSTMVTTFTSFPPLGVVLVALLGVGVAEHTGFINAALKALLNITAPSLLTPMVIFVGIISHTAVDAGYVLVIPLGGVIFYTAGRHPLAGIAAAFAGVSGGFSANFIPSSLDPLLAGLTQSGAQIIDATRVVNPLSNWYFTAASTIFLVVLGWFVTDRIVEPRLNKTTEVDGDPEEMPKMETLGPKEKKGLIAGLASMALGIAILVALSIPENSMFRSPAGFKITQATVQQLKAEGMPEEGAAKLGPILEQELFGKTALENALKARLGDENAKKFGEAVAKSAEPVAPQLTANTAPLMLSIVPLIFLLFIIPGIVYGYVAGTVSSHREIIAGMSKSMSTMGYYIVLAFFAALFIAAFGQSNLGALIAIKGANALQAMALPPQITIIGIIFLTGFVNLLIGSASAKWALLAPIFVPLLMQLGLSPELAQAAYRIGDSTTNIVTPLMPYFPLVVVFAQRYVKGTGIGTLISVMLPFTVVFMIGWIIFLIVYWALGIPLGLQAPYTYP
ncbi:AbgT family transporter [Leptolyngbya sp. 7M]|uniref:AbgT family transporter n=1 Tax=Leptolyngbya sp. 7M TaxID=2812896 RepID=UPI001B8AF7E6|nr:AbgT family transporter [Leptolyngbya sp. 7M]QYO65317.1 AbgT family transporter [Leptolyngbya sp. 7M]